jgi:anti-sigma factor RsiW
LIDLIEDRLPPDELAHLQEHLATCARCSSELARLERLIWLMRTDRGVDAPASAMTRAVRLFDSQTVPSSTSASMRRHILATRYSANAGFAPAFGVRSGQSNTQRLLFSAETHAVDLRIEPADQAWVVSGQVLGESAAGGWVELQGAPSVMQVVLNPQSEFTLPPIPAGHYQLILHLADVDVEVEPVGLGM